MQIRKFLTMFLALCLCLSLVPGAVFAEEPNNETPAAAGSATVTFDPNNGEAPWTQTVELNEVFADVACGQVTKPADPAKAAADGKRYEFNCWVANGSDFFSEGDAYVSGDITVTASYTEYLAEGWQIRVLSGDNYSYITDTATPLSTLLADTSATYNFEPVTEDSQVKRGLLSVNNGPHTVKFYYTKDYGETCTPFDSPLNPQSVPHGNVVSQFPSAPAGYHYVNSGDDVWYILNSQHFLNNNYIFEPIDVYAYSPQVVDDMFLGAAVEEHEWDDGSWVWRNIGGFMYAQYRRECTGCGEVEWFTATVTSNTVEGVTTFTATVTVDGTPVSDVRTLAEMYTVTFGEESNTYPWGGVATYNSPDGYPKKWKINGRVVADGVSTFVFAVTEDSTVTCVDTEATEQLAVISTALTSTETGKATFNAKWSLPEGAHDITVDIYRGYTTGDTDVEDYKIMAFNPSTVDTMSNVRNGDFTLNLTGLTSGTYQHVLINIRYLDRDGDSHYLTSGYDADADEYYADRVLVR